MELSLHPLIASLHLAYTDGPWVIFAAIAYRFVLPRLKGGR